MKSLTYFTYALSGINSPMITELLFLGEKFLLRKVPRVVTDAIFFNVLLNQSCADNRFILNISPAKELHTSVIMHIIKLL